MAPKSKRRCIADALENLEPDELEKFRRQLLDRKEEPRVRRARVKDKNYLEITDVLVSAFTEDGAVKLTEELLKEIGCLDAAKELVEDVRAQSAKPGSGGGDAGATGGGSKADAGATGGGSKAGAGATVGGSKADEVHFVDKHRSELINRVSHIEGILDELLDEKVIQQEMYDEIRTLPTTQKKMREIFSGCLKAGKSCKDILYKSLEKNEPYLIEELKKKK